MAGRVRPAVVQVDACTFSCPECHEPIVEPATGSQFFTLSDMPEPLILTCSGCNVSVSCRAPWHPKGLR